MEDKIAIFLLSALLFFVFLCETIWKQSIQDWHDRRLDRSCKRWYEKNKHKLGE